MKLDNVTIKGHKGTWYSLGHKELYLGDILTVVHLFEHEEYGDEAAHIIATESGDVVCDEAWDGWDNLRYVLEDTILTLELCIKILQKSLDGSYQKDNPLAHVLVPKQIALYEKQIENYKAI